MGKPLLQSARSNCCAWTVCGARGVGPPAGGKGWQPLSHKPSRPLGPLGRTYRDQRTLSGLVAVCAALVGYLFGWHETLTRWKIRDVGTSSVSHLYFNR